MLNADRIICAAKGCSREGVYVSIVKKRVLYGAYGDSLYNITPVTHRVLGWYHLHDGLFCSLDCYTFGLRALYSAHLDRCSQCNYDRDCLTCTVEGKTSTSGHACNCAYGQGKVLFGDGWGYHVSQAIEHLHRKNLHRPLPP